MRYFDWVGSALRGDLGMSLWSNQSVVELLLRRMATTLSLVLFAIVLAVLIGVRQRPAAVVAGLGIALLVFTAVFAARLAPYDPYLQDLLNRLQPPSAQHLLGTDDYGRDVLSRLIFGARISLTAALQAVVLALVLGGIDLRAETVGYHRFEVARD